MSDRRPEPEVKGMIVVDDWVDESVLGAWHFVTPEEVVDLVRRGVESGTIEGEVVELSRAATQYKWRCGNCGTDHGEAGCDDPDLVDYVLWQSKPELQEPGDYILVGPVSDGGSET